MPSRSQAKRWRALKRRKGRVEHGLFLAEGPRLVEELLASPLATRQVLYTEEAGKGPEVAALLDVCGGRDVPVEEVPGAELQEFADTVTPQGILAVAVIPEAAAGRLGPGHLVVLDAVQDPGNVGTIVRTAEALGAAGVVALEGTVDVWNPKVVRAAAGSLFRLPVVPAAWSEAAGWLRERALEVWAADAGGETVGREPGREGHVALVLGNEGAGVRGDVLAAADRRAAVPIAGPVESLNVAVAAGILMDRLFSSRRPGPGGDETRGRAGDVADRPGDGRRRAGG